MGPDPGQTGAALFDRPGTKDLGTKDLGTKDLGTKDLGTKDLGTKDLGTKDLGTEDLGTEDLPAPRSEPPTVRDPRGPGAIRARPSRRGPDPATITHLASLVGAFAFWAWLDRALWFFGDEWDYLVNRGLRYGPANHDSIWFPHNEHWSTLPVLLWRGLFNIFHLSTYWPYLVPLLLAQLGVMHLTWRLCRRAGVHVWVATASVTLLGFLGAGSEDFGWGFQIGFVGSVFFGLLAFDLLDDAAPRTVARRARAAVLVPSHRPLAASAALLASLMCSTIGDAMVVGAAVLAVARLPRRRALAVIGPPVLAYSIWFGGVGHLGLSAHSDRLTLATFTALPNYVWTGLSGDLGQVFNLEAAGAAILMGLGAWVAWHMRRLWVEHPALLGLCAAALAFYALAAVGRDASQVNPNVSRYVYVAVALLLPVMATVLSSLGAWPAARVTALALLAFTILGNIGQAQTWTSSRTAIATTLKKQLFATGELVAAGVTDVSGPQAAPIETAPNLSVADIKRLERSHLLPDGPLSPLDMVNARTVLAVGVWDGFNMTFSGKPLSGGKFDLVKVMFGTVTAQHKSCATFAPQAISPAMQVWLHIPAGQTSASVKVVASPAPPGTINYAAALLVPSRPPSTSIPLELAVPAKGTGYLNDNYGGADLVITWVEGTSVTMCGFSPPT